MKQSGIARPGLRTLVRLIALAFAQILVSTVATAQEQSWRSPVWYSTQAYAMQAALEKMNCYVIGIDGEWGQVSNAGLADYVTMEWGSFRQVPSSLRNDKSILAHLRDNRSNRRCAGSTSAGSSDPKYLGTCNRTEVIQKWLDANPKAARLSASLDDIGAQFAQIFGSKDVKGTQETVGTEKVQSRDLFLAAKLRLSSLIERNSLAGNASCQKCSILSDWLLLRRLAKPTQGLLSSYKTPALKLDVDLMDHEFVKDSEEDVERVRNYIAHIEEDPLGADGYRDLLKKTIGDAVDWLDSQKKGGRLGDSLKGELKNYKCIGFDGF